MKDWLMTLTQRERYMVVAAVVTAVLLIVQLLVIDPVSSNYAKLQKNVQASTSKLQWMQNAAKEIKSLGGTSSFQKHRSGKQFVLGLIERTVKNYGLTASMKRIKPEGTSGARVWFESAAFDELLKWLDVIQSQHGLVVTDITVEKQPVPGIVNARVFLEQ